jgi:hypothetical protein
MHLVLEVGFVAGYSIDHLPDMADQIGSTKMAGLCGGSRLSDLKNIVRHFVEFGWFVYSQED